jgi:hypothetical protein
VDDLAETDGLIAFSFAAAVAAPAATVAAARNARRELL